MIRKLFFTTLLLANSAFAVEKTVIFVGEQISYEGKTFEDQQVLICPDANQDEVCVTMDSMYLAKYRVKQVIKGDIKGKELEYYQFDHYGVPDYFKYKYALIVVDVTDRGIFGHKYTSIPVYKDDKNDYYYCPSPDESFVFDDEAKKVNYDPPVSIDTTHYSKQGIQDIVSSNFYEQKDGQIYCAMGVPLEYAAEYILE